MFVFFFIYLLIYNTRAITHIQLLLQNNEQKKTSEFIDRKIGRGAYTFAI